MTEQQFIEKNLSKSLPEIALLLSKYADLNKDFIINQVNGLKKAKNKLPEFFQNKDIQYPATISIEQCSSEQTAEYKSKLVEVESVIDLTGGFGIDSYYFSKKAKEVTYIEPNEDLFKTVSQNFNTLNAKNITCVNSNAEDFLASNSNLFDLAYIDPSRRNENQKVFMLGDCIPNIVDLQNDIFKITSKILVKTSPILDIKQSIKELKTVAEVWVVSVNNECKEVLYLLDKNFDKGTKINTINLTKEKQVYSFTYNQEEISTVEYSVLQTYLYEPNTSILKAGAFKSICAKYDLKKIAANTHLYTSEKPTQNFPGRTFKIEQTLPYNPKNFKKLGIKKANVSCRNFKDSVEEVKKKLNLKDGGDTYIFALLDNSKKPILTICKKD